jgi:hypothetical protein
MNEPFPYVLILSWFSLGSGASLAQSKEIADPPDVQTAADIDEPGEEWVLFTSRVTEDEGQLSYNQLDPLALQYVQELEQMSDVLRGLEAQLIELHSSIPAMNMREMERLAEDLNRLMSAHPDGPPVELATEAQTKNSRFQQLIALHGPALDRIDRITLEYTSYYDGTYEPKWRAFEACTCSRPKP